MSVLEALAILEAASWNARNTRWIPRVTSRARFFGTAHSTRMADSTISPQPRRRAKHEYAAREGQHYVSLYPKFNQGANRKTGRRTGAEVRRNPRHESKRRNRTLA